MITAARHDLGISHHANMVRLEESTLVNRGAHIETGNMRQAAGASRNENGGHIDVDL